MTHDGVTCDGVTCDGVSASCVCGRVASFQCRWSPSARDPREASV